MLLTLTIDQPWGWATASTSLRTVSYQAYVTVPSDFQDFISVWDPTMNWQA